MCKIFITSGISAEPEKQELAWKLIWKMTELMSRMNSDGLGFAAITHSQKLYGERWHDNSDAFINRGEVKKPKVNPKLKDKVKKFEDFLDIPDKEPEVVKEKPKYNAFANSNITKEDTICAITLHARMATSGKEFYNTHPFYDKKTSTSLIHNGVIRNIFKDDLFRSTCDSEKILNKYLEHDVRNKPDNIQKVAKDLSGYYACGVFSKTSAGNMILDIFKDNTASLHGGYIEELDTFAFTTSSTDLKEACEAVGLTLVQDYAVNKDVLLRLNPLTGEVISKTKFKSDTWSYSGNNGYNSKWDRNRGHTGEYLPTRKEDKVVDLIEVLDEETGWCRNIAHNTYFKKKVG